jgi:histidine ammonia-lyase
MLSNGNFHVPALAIAFDALGIALAHVALMAVNRCQKLYSPGLSGLPLQLTSRGPEHSGFATLQKTLAALWSEVPAAREPRVAGRGCRCPRRSRITRQWRRASWRRRQRSPRR